MKDNIRYHMHETRPKGYKKHYSITKKEHSEFDEKVDG